MVGFHLLQLAEQRRRDGAEIEQEAEQHHSPSLAAPPGVARDCKNSNFQMYAHQLILQSRGGV